MSDEDLKNLGPLAYLLGRWEGQKGDDVAPSNLDRHQVARSKYREEMSFESTGRVDNHEQVLYGLRYRTTAWRVDEPDPFHEEVGYWMWDAKDKQVIRCFMVPRGVSVIAGGDVDPIDTEWSLSAEVGSETYGICSNKFLDREFKTVRYDFKLTWNDDGTFTYDEDTVLQVKGAEELFHHTDSNTMRKVEG